MNLNSLNNKTETQYSPICLKLKNIITSQLNIIKNHLMLLLSCSCSVFQLVFSFSARFQLFSVRVLLCSIRVHLFVFSCSPRINLLVLSCSARVQFSVFCCFQFVFCCFQFVSICSCLAVLLVFICSCSVVQLVFSSPYSAVFNSCLVFRVQFIFLNKQ